MAFITSEEKTKQIKSLQKQKNVHMFWKVWDNRGQDLANTSQISPYKEQELPKSTYSGHS